jgi:kynurenine formamidase
VPSPFDSHDWVDLSHTLEEGIPAWPTHARFSSTPYESKALGDVATHNGLTISEHSGTHMDAPLHFVLNGPAHYGTDGIPLERLAGRAATIDATALEPDEPLLCPDRIRAWEGEHGPLEPGDRVLVRYGWAERWATGGEGRRFLEDWPGLSGEAAEYLVEKGVALVGCDTLAVDAAGSEENPAHHALLGNEVYVVENLKNLKLLPPFCLFLALPLKIKGGSGSPVRAVALVPR